MNSKIRGDKHRSLSCPEPRRDEVRFGFYGSYPYYGNAVSLPPQSNYLAGFVPGGTVKELFKSFSSPYGNIVTSQKELDSLWKVTGLPERDKPAPDWKKEFLLLVAQERTRNATVIPRSINFQPHRNLIEVILDKEKRPGREPGVAWYIGRFSNGAETDDDKRRNRYTVDRHTRVYTWAVNADPNG